MGVITQQKIEKKFLRENGMTKGEGQVIDLFTIFGRINDNKREFSSEKKQEERGTESLEKCTMKCTMK